jgi:hypothetical protein
MTDEQVISLSPGLEFSYSQFFVYDAGIKNPACAWTEQHSRQGFARRAGVVAIGTLLEFGRADVTLVLGRPDLSSFERAVGVPLEIKSGAIAVDGPDEDPGIRRVPIKNGHYRAVIAQRRIDESAEVIRIWLEKVDVPVIRSELLIADNDLDPPSPLVETSTSP